MGLEIECLVSDESATELEEEVELCKPQTHPSLPPPPCIHSDQLLARLYFLQVPDPPQTAPIAGDQVLKHDLMGDIT